MKNKFILLYWITNTLGMISFYFIGEANAKRKINKKINSLGNLNVTYNGNKPELYLQLNKSTLDLLKQTRYAVFDVKILETKQPKIDA